jgi:hypothetical protein
MEELGGASQDLAKVTSAITSEDAVLIDSTIERLMSGMEDIVEDLKLPPFTPPPPPPELSPTFAALEVEDAGFVIFSCVGSGDSTACGADFALLGSFSLARCGTLYPPSLQSASRARNSAIKPVAALLISEGALSLELSRSWARNDIFFLATSFDVATPCCAQ